jgi:hypothetical protein
MSGFSDDIETYLWLCERYNVVVQYKNYNGNKVPDVYGSHAQELWERHKKEQHNELKGKSI